MTQLTASLTSPRGVTIYSVNRRNDSWRYASVRLLGGVVQVTAPGYANWQPLSDVSTQPELAPHARFVVKLARHAVEVLCDGTPLAKGFTLCIPVLCADGCGRLLTHPRSIEAGMGPTCRGTVAAAKARTAARSAAAGSFIERMAARRNGPR